MKDFSNSFTKKFYLSLMLLALFPAWNVGAANTVFERSLKLGMSGEDVRQLQITLNLSHDTQISNAGPGSPGQETTYFGTLTQRAVINFQEKYADEILVPNSLSSGNGFVGISTRSVLNRFAGISQNQSNTVVNTVAPTNPAVKSAVQTNIVTKTNPNEKNLDVFLSALDTVARKNGKPEGVSMAIKDQIRKDIATSTNLQEKFLDVVQKQVSSAIPEIQTTSYIGDFWHNIKSSFKTTFFPKQAVAQVGSDFGGALLFSFFCNCSANWLLTITPLPPTFATLLTYQTGSQAFLSNNIPITTWLLGKYMNGAGICLVVIGTGCADLPSEGMITPFVGSSPI